MRLRKKSKSARKSNRGKRLRSALALALVGALIYILGWSPLLTVKKIEIIGTPHSDLIAQDINRDHIALKIKMPLARVDVKAISHSVLSHTWIASSKISRDWIGGGVKIVTSERAPVASYTSDTGEQRYFDSTGASFTYPTPITGLPVVSLKSGEELSRKSAARVIAGVSTDLLSGMSDLQVLSPIKIIMDSRLGTKTIHIIWGDSSELALKNKVLSALLLLPENQKASSFDLTNPREPITK
jgi:cell division protein FtsQ